MLLAITCPICGERSGAPCPGCVAGLWPAGPLPPVAGVDTAVALFAHDRTASQLVTSIKYRNARRALPWLGRRLAAAVTDAEIRLEAITWAPTTAVRRRTRGFDHAELLARRVATELGRPCRRLLRRSTTDAQTGRTRSARISGVAFTACRPAPAAVLIVDDVMTTGATARAAARAVRRAGAETVAVAVVSHRP